MINATNKKKKKRSKEMVKEMAQQKNTKANGNESRGGRNC